MLSQKFHEIRRFLSKIPNINRGGCGVAAHVLFHLARKEGEQLGIYLGYNNIIEYNIDTENISQNKLPEYVHHVFLKDCKDRVIDAGGFFFVDAYRYHLPINGGYLAYMLDHKIWNSDFDREKYILLIEDMTGITVGTKLHINEEVIQYAP